MELDHNSHSVFLLYYHLVMVIKYRRKVLNDEISERAGIFFQQFVEVFHKNSFPKTELSKFINAYKSASSRLLKKSIPR